MSPGSITESHPAFAHIGLRENPGKTSTSTLGGHAIATVDRRKIILYTKCILSCEKYQKQKKYVWMYHTDVRRALTLVEDSLCYLWAKEAGVSSGKKNISDILLFGFNRGAKAARNICAVYGENAIGESTEENGSVVSTHNILYKKVEKFKYLAATVTNINDTREEIKRRINMGNACYYSVEKLLSSSLLSKNLKVRIYKTVILPVVLYGCETWTLTLREEQRLRVFENKVLRKIFGAKKDEVTGEWRKLHNTELHALYSSPDIIRNIKSRRFEMGRACSTYGRIQKCIQSVSWEAGGKKTFREAET
ncbi:hypothetical protein ANN_00044 [Periplaneta americana]|uniref:Uncharacterized protein n=1 Tax=Periplaneta americana TaxID=6978 RepID=A0ABQ8TSU1_PERAM|nr:hypothetical protein ANN_00044 [Periplaneta americana]